MPVNKAARFRFEVIDECLRNTKRNWSKSELLNYVNRRLQIQYDNIASISLSQLRYDLENMQYDYGAPIEMYREGKMYFYRYTDPDFSIKNIPLDEEELVKLNNAVQILQQLKGFTIAEDIAEIVKKLEAKCNIEINDKRNIIEFESNLCKNENDTLEDIYHAIIRKKVLKISYLPYRAKKMRTSNVHPYILKRYCVWYLVGCCQETHKIEIYELDCIHDIKVTNLPFVEDLFIKAESYFQHLIGVTKPSDDIQYVELYFSDARAPYILSYPVHNSQQVIEKYSDGSVKIAVQLIVNQEFINLLLSYGDNVKVLTPQSLVNTVVTAAHSLLKRYDHADAP